LKFDLPTPAVPAPDLSGRERLRAFLDMWLVDHGFIRDVYWNLRRVSTQAWRSAQPSPRHLRRVKERGIRTILNLRGRRDTCGSYILEREACERLGLTLIDFPIRSRQMLDKPTLHAAGELFKRMEYPVLMHCKSGADRAGLMATLYLFVHEGVPLRRAMRHLSLSYGHVKQAKTGMIDFFFERYLADTRERPMAFFDWVERVYDAERLQAEFHENWLAGIIVNYVLRRE
jgi:protein tyrosine/serine phosphatase